VPGDEKVQKQLPRFELVEWYYDGLKGKIIPWTKKHGGTSDDPSTQAFVVRPDGSVAARCKTGDAYSANNFAKWLDEQADAFEKLHPRTRVPLVMAEVVAQGEGASRELRVPALEEALEAGEKPVLLYVGLGARDGQDKKRRAQAAKARKFEKAVLDSKSAAAAAQDFVLLRLDLADADHAAYAKAKLSVEQAPTLLLWKAGAEKPENLGAKLTASSLAHKLKKAK
jgi:hypothetical protein